MSMIYDVDCLKQLSLFEAAIHGCLKLPIAELVSESGGIAETMLSPTVSVS